MGEPGRPSPAPAPTASTAPAPPGIQTFAWGQPLHGGAQWGGRAAAHAAASYPNATFSAANRGVQAQGGRARAATRRLPSLWTATQPCFFRGI